MPKKESAKESSKKTIKKVKSFNLDDKVYSGLMEIFESSGTHTTLSAVVDEFLRKLYVYLIEADGVIKRWKSDMPLSSVVYDCQTIEYFREANKNNRRVRNLMLSYEASSQGMTLREYLATLPHEELEDIEDVLK